MSEFYIDRLIGKPFAPSRVEVIHTHLYMFHFLLSSFYSQIRSKVGNILVNPTLSRLLSVMIINIGGEGEVGRGQGVVKVKKSILTLKSLLLNDKERVK